MPTRAKIYQPTARNIATLATKLRRGELVAVPSETVYGLAANALNAAACEQIFEVKRRPKNDPLIVHIYDLGQIEELAHTRPIVQKIAAAFWPGPLTLVLNKKSTVPAIVTAGRDSVAVRLPSHPVFLSLLKECRLPLAAPSANPFGYVSPTTAAHVKNSLGTKIGAILEGGPCQIGIESTILDARDEACLRILRPGAITAERLKRVAGVRVESFSTPEKSDDIAVSEPQLAPGQLGRHYSPKAQIVLYHKIPDSLADALPTDAALLYFRRPNDGKAAHARGFYWLTERGDQEEAARQLFAKLRELDEAGIRTIHAELAPAGELATALNDRLRRAALF